MTQRDTTRVEIAAKHLFSETLKTRDMAVWSIKAALEVAWEAQ